MIDRRQLRPLGVVYLVFHELKSDINRLGAVVKIERPSAVN